MTLEDKILANKIMNCETFAVAMRTAANKIANKIMNCETFAVAMRTALSKGAPKDVAVEFAIAFTLKYDYTIPELQP